MRFVLALLFALLAPAILASGPAAAEEVKRFEKPDLRIAFEYQAKWSAVSTEPRGVLPNEVFDVRANGGPATGFLVAVYQLSPPVTMDTLDATLEQLDKHVQAWVATLPGGKIVEIYDTIVDDADGREYGYEYQLEGRTIRADMILVPNADKVVEITQWATAEEYPQQVSTFDAIFGSLVLPWSKPLS
jgi:hypothetical protein